MVKLDIEHEETPYFCRLGMSKYSISAYVLEAEPPAGTSVPSGIEEL